MRHERMNKPADLLAHAQEHAPGGDGAERETRTSWIVADEEAPLGEWWIAKCCGRVFDHSAKLGGHRCTPGEPRWQWEERTAKERAARGAAYDARRAALAARPFWRFW